MTRWPLALCCALLWSIGCNRAAEDKQGVRQGVLQHLQKNAALDLNQLDVNVTDVKFNGAEAVASVAIKPKSAPDQGMSMSYTLERRSDKWEVKGKGAGHTGMPGAGQVSPTPEAPATGRGRSGELPAGHPPVNAPAPKSD